MSTDHESHANDSIFQGDSSETSVAPLSAAGQARRDAMLQTLTAEIPRVAQRRRRAKQSGIAMFSVAITGAILTLAIISTPRTGQFDTQPIASDHAPSDTATHNGVDPSDEPPAGAHLIITAHTDPSVLDRWSVSTHAAAHGVEVVGSRATLVQYIGDAELLRTLAAIGRPCGIIRMDGRTILSARVTDAELFPDQGAEDANGSG